MSTRDKIAEIRAKDPEARASDISRALGISRERVRQHLVGLGLTTKTYGPRRRVAPTPRVQTGGVMIGVTYTAAGTVSELLVAADLTARGYTVYSPICRHRAHADLIALLIAGEQQPILIEVRSGKRSQSGAVIYAKKNNTRCNHYGVVVTGEPVIYDPPLP